MRFEDFLFVKGKIKMKLAKLVMPIVGVWGAASFGAHASFVEQPEQKSELTTNPCGRRLAIPTAEEKNCVRLMLGCSHLGRSSQIVLENGQYLGRIEIIELEDKRFARALIFKEDNQSIKELKKEVGGPQKIRNALKNSLNDLTSNPNKEKETIEQITEEMYNNVGEDNPDEPYVKVLDLPNDPNDDDEHHENGNENEYYEN
jgi:hypothetical protein